LLSKCDMAVDEIRHQLFKTSPNVHDITIDIHDVLHVERDDLPIIVVSECDNVFMRVMACLLLTNGYWPVCKPVWNELDGRFGFDIFLVTDACKGAFIPDIIVEWSNDDEFFIDDRNAPILIKTGVTSLYQACHTVLEMLIE